MMHIMWLSHDQVEQEAFDEEEEDDDDEEEDVDFDEDEEGKSLVLLIPACQWV